VTELGFELGEPLNSTVMLFLIGIYSTHISFSNLFFFLACILCLLESSVDSENSTPQLPRGLDFGQFDDV
jgi:hypothetical protein